MYAQLIEGGTTPERRDRDGPHRHRRDDPRPRGRARLRRRAQSRRPRRAATRMMIVLWETEAHARRALGEYGARLPEGARRRRRDLHRHAPADLGLGGQRAHLSDDAIIRVGRRNQTPSRRLGATLRLALMDDAPQTEEFVVGDSFAGILTETTQSLVCVLDREGRILLFNEACERATGFSRDEVIGRYARDVVIPPEERDAFGEFLAYVWRTGTPSPQVGHWLTKRGGRRLVAWSNRLMGARTGRRLAGHDGHRPDRPRAPPRRGRRALAGRPRGQAGRGRPARDRAARAAPRGDAGRVGGQPRAGLHGGVGGVRPRAEVNASVVVRYEGDGTATIVGRHNRDSDRRLPGRRRAAGRRALRDRTRARTGAPARIDDWGGRTGESPRRCSAPATAPPRRRRSSCAARSGARSGSRARTRCRPTARTGSARSASSSRSPSPAPRRART